MQDGCGTELYCPAYSEFNLTELVLVAEYAIGVSASYPLSCFTCPDKGSNCSTVVSEVMATADIANDQNFAMCDLNILDTLLGSCKQLCELNSEGEWCNQDSDNQCTEGELFCDYSPGDTEFADGTCRKCPINPETCLQEGFVSTSKGRQNCHACSLTCWAVSASKLWVDGEFFRRNLSMEPFKSLTRMLLDRCTIVKY